MPAADEEMIGNWKRLKRMPNHPSRVLPSSSLRGNRQDKNTASQKQGHSNFGSALIERCSKPELAWPELFLLVQLEDLFHEIGDRKRVFEYSLQGLVIASHGVPEHCALVRDGL